jgi:hypothetical protein
MSNIYERHLEELQKISKQSEALVSLFVPMRCPDSSPEKTLSTLIKTANTLLKKQGYPEVSLSKVEWEKWNKQGTNTLAIYQGSGITTFIPLPVKMNPRVVVASTFHVKPLVASSSEHLEALVLHFNKFGVSLFRVSQTNEILVDSYQPSRTYIREDWPVSLEHSEVRDFLEFLKLEINGTKRSSTKLLAITGTNHRSLQIKGIWKECNLPIFFLEDSFMNVVPEKAIPLVRFKLETEIKEEYRSIVKKILSGEPAAHEDHGLTTLGKKILKKEIKTLCISLEDLHFGEVNNSTGELILRRSQQNVKDDDVLDDLLELALKNGVSVSVVPKLYLPSGTTYLAS